jgi:hypothetical protein
MRKSCDYHNMKLVFHGTDKQISWRLEGREVFRVTKPGYLIDRQYMILDFGGAEGPIFPQSVFYGIGTSSIVDAYPACKRSDTSAKALPILPMSQPLFFTIPSLGPRIWQSSGNPTTFLEMPTKSTSSGDKVLPFPLRSSSFIRIFVPDASAKF